MIPTNGQLIHYAFVTLFPYTEYQQMLKRLNQQFIQEQREVSAAPSPQLQPEAIYTTITTSSPRSFTGRN